MAKCDECASKDFCGNVDNLEDSDLECGDFLPKEEWEEK